MKYLQIHHSASPRDTTTFDDIERWHRARGWNGCGYNYVIDGQGKVYIGRDEGSQLAACPGHNKDSIAICVCGNFEEEKPNQPQLVRLRLMVSNLRNDYPGIQLVGHNELKATACPGKNLISILPSLI